MKYAWLGCLLWGSLLLAGPQESEMNVNTRYTVEGVVIAADGWRVDVASEKEGKISAGLRRDLLALIGEKLNPVQLEDVARRLRREFSVRTVSHRVLRGAKPEYVRVVFELKSHPTRFDVSVPKFLY